MRGGECAAKLRRDISTCGFELSSNVVYHSSNLNNTALLVEISVVISTHRNDVCGGSYGVAITGQGFCGIFLWFVVVYVA